MNSADALARLGDAHLRKTTDAMSDLISTTLDRLPAIEDEDDQLARAAVDVAVCYVLSRLTAADLLRIGTSPEAIAYCERVQAEEGAALLVNWNEYDRENPERARARDEERAKAARKKMVIVEHEAEA